MNRTEVVAEPFLFFQELGGLHDAQIERIIWDASVRRVAICVDDLNSNFVGLPEYVGRREVSMVFTEVENVSFNCDAIKNDLQRIYELVMQKKDGLRKYELTMTISPSGRLSFECESVQIIDVLNPRSESH